MLAALRRLVLSACLAIATGGAVALDATPSVSIGQLPPEARQTLSLIKQGGPFPHPRKDGSVFGNFEKRLPVRSRGYYREFTVPTPGARNRGARRIVAGAGASGDVRTSGEYWYTADHYKTFLRIRE